MRGKAKQRLLGLSSIVFRTGSCIQRELRVPAAVQRATTILDDPAQSWMSFTSSTLRAAPCLASERGSADDPRFPMPF